MSRANTHQALGKRGTRSHLATVVAGAAKGVSAKQVQVQPEQLSAAHRENPEKLSGQALKDLGHRRGLSRSAMATMSDEKIRTELRYLAYAQYETAEA